MRTEHMFFASDERLKAVRQMIMAETVEARRKALGNLLPFQRSDFEGIFTAMNGLPVRSPCLLLKISAVLTGVSFLFHRISNSC